MSDRLEHVARALRGAADAVLSATGPGVADIGAAEVRGEPLAAAELPAVVAEVPLDGGASGAVLLVLTEPGALRLAAVLGAIDEEAAEFGGAALDPAALEAIGSLTAGIAARAASGAGVPMSAGRASTRTVSGAAELQGLTAGGETAVVSLSVLGEAALAVQVVPAAVAARPGADAAPAAAAHGGAAPLGAALRDVSVRVWAELGRSRMPTGEVIGLPSGAIVELDREAEDAVDLYVDGQLYATGRLVVCEDESWGVRVERVLGLS